MTASTSLDAALRAFHSTGSVSLPGAASEPLRRWLRGRRIAIGICFGVAGLGVLLLGIGLILRAVGAWRLLMLAGAALLLIGALTGLIMLLTGLAWTRRVRSEQLPVIIDATGLALRGIGPIPWADLMSPEWWSVTVKNDIGGVCVVMPLTQHGQSQVDAQPGWRQNILGPKPYLSPNVPALLLPGIDGLTTTEVMRLVGDAQSRFTYRP